MDLSVFLDPAALLALAGGILATMAAVPMAWLSVRAPGRLQRILEACHYYVGSLPGVVVALALVSITVRFLLPLYQTFAMLLAGYVLLFLPRAMVGLRASIAQAPVELERAALALGRTPAQALRQVTLREGGNGGANLQPDQSAHGHHALLELRNFRVVVRIDVSVLGHVSRTFRLRSPRCACRAVE